MIGAMSIPPPPAPPPTAHITDHASWLVGPLVSDLDTRLRACEARTGHEILVYIAPTTGDIPIDQWAYRAFWGWHIGRHRIDDGLVLFIFTRDRTMRLEVGYGLESKVPRDVQTSILNETIAPKLAAGRANDAVAAGVDRILSLVGCD
jgi:uncharacterized protein